VVNCEDYGNDEMRELLPLLKQIEHYRDALVEATL
jgi:hypothetical protein